MFRTFAMIAFINAFLAVALGAFGAHGLEGTISKKMLEIWKTGIQYQMFHTIGLFAVSILSQHVTSTRLLARAGWFFVIGIVLFSGSLYALSTTGIRMLGMITPFGGVAFLIGWFLLARAVAKK